MSKFNKFEDLGARMVTAVFVGGGLYGFFGPNRQMGCDGVIGVGRYYGWISRNLFVPNILSTHLHGRDSALDGSNLRSLNLREGQIGEVGIQN